VERLTALTSFPAERFLDKAGTGAGGIGADRREASAEGANAERDNKVRYRVDDAYKTYTQQDDHQPPRHSDSPGVSGPRKFSSAELLDSMIHQMGGAATSSAKGVFVDIAV